MIGALTLGLLTATPANAEGSFYDPPSELTGSPGELVRSEPMRLGVSVDHDGDVSPLPGTATRIMYQSTDALGEPVAVSGVYIEPSKSWQGGGDRPLVSFAEGTQGQGDPCAPSRTLEQLLVVEDGSISIGYEIPSIYAFLDRGIAVVVTDYIGLGTTDRVHSYVVRLDSGHAVLDAARVASTVPGASVTADSPVGLYGYSQGGGAVASAAELAPTYAPELELKGAYAGAPPADLAEVMQTADRTALTGVIGFALNGISQYDPALVAALEPELNANGRATLDALSERCIGDALLGTGTAFGSTSSWTTSGSSLYQVAQRTPAALAAIDAQRIGTLEPEIPVMVLTGTKDDIVGHDQAKQLAKDWCAKGAAVRYVSVVQPASSHGTGLNHLTPLITRAAQGQSWLVDRLEGRAAYGNCAFLPVLP
ncbi:lipase family protein [Agromyces rhizosphaerae]|uniref:lipase family protein n=1 Tax=Agromyces rhizosphaerae TaxID=88374 RepID=UPI002492A819|nr:alpha/beta fold hydrolase [Agromyces rhizosphaerae]